MTNFLKLIQSLADRPKSDDKTKPVQPESRRERRLKARTAAKTNKRKAG